MVTLYMAHTCETAEAGWRPAGAVGVRDVTVATVQPGGMLIFSSSFLLDTIFSFGVQRKATFLTSRPGDLILLGDFDMEMTRSRRQLGGSRRDKGCCAPWAFSLATSWARHLLGVESA